MWKMCVVAGLEVGRATVDAIKEFADPLIAAESSLYRTFSNFAIAALSAAASSSRCSSRAASRARPFSDMGGRGDARDEAILLSWMMVKMVNA